MWQLKNILYLYLRIYTVDIIYLTGTHFVIMGYSTTQKRKKRQTYIFTCLEWCQIVHIVSWFTWFDLFRV